MGVQLFIFDLDGVITHTSVYHAQAWKEVCARLGLSFNETLVEGTKGISRRASLELILAYYGLSDNFSEVEKQRLMDEKNKLYRQLLEQITEDDYLPGIRTLLEDIKRHGHPIAIASASENAQMILHQMKAERYIDFIVDPKQIKRGKPAPDIFLAAAHHFNAMPERCIAIEDAQSGIEAIKQAGMFAVGIGPKLVGADLVVEQSDQLTYRLLLEAYLKR